MAKSCLGNLHLYRCTIPINQCWIEFDVTTNLGIQKRFLNKDSKGSLFLYQGMLKCLPAKYLFFFCDNYMIF